MTMADPSTAALAWVAVSVGAATALRLRHLPGGTHAATDLVRTGDGNELVLRRFPPGDDAVHRESRVLGVLDGLGGLAPRLLAADPEGEHCGEPAILTTRLPGRACVTPDDPYDFADQLGVALARVHVHDADAGLRDLMAVPPVGVGPVAGQVVDAWDRLSDAPRVLTHNDYWSGNTLWHGGRLTGVVDWSGAGLAPCGFDVSWCRLDLILLHDRATADVFTAAYEAVRGAVPDMGLWDLFAATNAHRGIEDWAPNYQSLGRTDLGPATLRRRLTDWTALLDQRR